jgi:hypothetical protein
MGAKKAVTAAKAGVRAARDGAAAKTAVDAYRATHPVKAFWYETEQAAIDAVCAPGASSPSVRRERLRAVKAGAYLYIILPSGRPLSTRRQSW